MTIRRSGQLIADARAVLDANWNGAFTRPNPDQYPHQWNWDTGFIAIGYAHYDQDRAESELRHLFSAQWKNGKVPHIVFNPDAVHQYFPGPDFWRAHEADQAPDGMLTSGLTMPPVHATAALRVFETAPDRDRARAFLRELYPALVRSHRYLYTDRDPAGEGLAYIRHPWESGTDNAPTWDVPLERIDLSAVDVPSYERKDLRAVAADQRPTDLDYDRYVHLVDLHRRLRYREEALYDTYDVRHEEPIPTHAVSAFAPLFAGIPSKDQAARLVEALRGPGFGSFDGEGLHLVPSFDVRRPTFQHNNYWRGPVWINLNWILYHGLKRYGYDEPAAAIRSESIELLDRYSFCEYFSPFRRPPTLTGGFGSGTFSWSAALCIDFLQAND